jgi:hypothetical protein
MHWNALCDLQIQLDAKIQVQRNVFRRAFCASRTIPNRTQKIVHRRFVPRTLWNALRDQQFSRDEKTHVQCNVSYHTFCGIRTSPTGAFKIVRRRFMPQMH